MRRKYVLVGRYYYCRFYSRPIGLTGRYSTCTAQFLLTDDRVLQLFDPLQQNWLSTNERYLVGTSMV